MRFVGILLLLLPLSLAADVFRCQSKGDTYYSQIPCKPDSEVVELEEHSLLTDSGQGSVDSAAQTQQQVQVTTEQNTRRSPQDGMREFVQTLQRQQSEQLLAVDRQIETLESQIESSDSDSPERMDLGEQLLVLQESRSTISSQYDSMISETQRRLEE